jgi:ferredoxin
MGLALILAVGLIVNIGILSLVSGALHFLFGRPRVEILKSELGSTGFAFAFKWDSSREPAKFNRIRLRLFNPFGNPTQVEILREFDGHTSDFALDFDFGAPFKELISAKNFKDALVQIELSSVECITHQIEMRGSEFLAKKEKANLTAGEFNTKYKVVKEKPKFSIPDRTFIAPPLPKTGKALKLATNPEFAGSFAGGAGDAPVAAVANFAVTKVWIEPGCIVCNACEGIYPEVFEVTDTTCLIRPGAPLDDGLKIQESADACPVEVIKFIKA